MAGWICGIVLALVVGIVAGRNSGEQSARNEIAQECRSAGSFVIRRTAFDCEVRRK